MEKTWTMTVTIAPPDHDDTVLPQPQPDFDGLSDHFRTLVEMNEAHVQLSQLG
jgi:hypothetical protein